MSFFEPHGNPAESLKGTPIVVGRDPESDEDVTFVIRPLPLDVAQDIENRFGEEQRVPIEQRDDKGQLISTRFRMEKVRTTAEEHLMLVEKAAWAWVDGVNVPCRPKDEAAVAFLRSELKDDSITLGVNFKLDGRLKHTVKKWLLRNRIELVGRILMEARKLDREERESREKKVGNS